MNRWLGLIVLIVIFAGSSVINVYAQSVNINVDDKGEVRFRAVEKNDGDTESKSDIKLSAPEDAPESGEYVANLADFIKTGKMSAVEILKAELISSESGKIKIKIKSGSLTGVTADCQMSAVTTGVSYGYRSNHDQIAALVKDGVAKNAESEVDKRLAAHAGKDIKVGISGDACTYLELLK